MAEFSQFGVQGRNFSDIAPAQAPVADTSKASAIAGITQGVASIANIGIGLYQKDQEQQKVEAQSLQTRSFEEDLLKAKDIAEQEGAESIKFKTFLTQKFRGSQLEYGTKAKMLKDFQSTVLGKVFTEVSPEQEAQEAGIKSAFAAGFWQEGDSEQDIAHGVLQWQKKEQNRAANAAQIQELTLQRARTEANDAERAALDKGLLKTRYAGLANLAADERPAIKKNIDGIVAGFKNGSLDRKTAEQLLVQAKGDLTSRISLETRGLDRSQVDPLANPLLSLYDVAIDNVDSKTLLEEVENQNALAIAQTSRNTFLQDPELVALVSASSLTKHNSPALAVKINERTAELLSKQSIDPTADDQGSDAYREILLDSVDKIDRVDKAGEPLIKQEELLNDINKVLVGSAKYISPEDVPENNKKILEWLANPKLGPFIKDNLPLLDARARDQVVDAIDKSAVNFVYPAFTSTLNSEVKVAGKRFGVSEDDIDMREIGGKVRFVAMSSNNWAKSVANKMNNELSGALSTYWNAVGNISGDGFSTTFDREKAILWPSKYGEQSTQEGAPEVDFSQFEGRTGTDAEGNRFVVRNGVPVKVGDNGNE